MFLTRTKPRLRPALILLALSLFLAAGAARGADAPAGGEPAPADGIMTRVVEQLSRNDVMAAVRLFHFPPQYSREQLSADKAGLAMMFDLLHREFGPPVRFTPAARTAPHTDVSVEGADPVYWQQHPRTVSISFDVEFQREGKGIVTVHACRILDEWQVRKVYYGLYSDRPGAPERVREIMVRMMELLKGLQPPPPVPATEAALPASGPGEARCFAPGSGRAG